MKMSHLGLGEMSHLGFGEEDFDLSGRWRWPGWWEEHLHGHHHPGQERLGVSGQELR